MARLQFNGQQYTITISKDLIKRMKWKKGTEIFIMRNKEKDYLYLIENE